MKEELQDLLFDKLERLAVPILGHIYLTDSCQLNCFHCYRAGAKKKQDLNTFEWIRLLNEFKDEGCIDLTFSGGEPLLHPGWKEIINEASRLKFSFEVMTNAFSINENDVDFLKEKNCRELHVSVHGFEDKHDEFVGVSGAFERAKRITEYSVTTGMKTIVKMSLMHSNFKEASVVAEWVKSIGAIFGPSYYIIPRFIPGDDDFLANRLSAEEIRKCEEEYSKWTDRPSFSNCYDTNSTLFCNMGWNRFAIDAEGNLYPCSQVAEPVGSVKYNSFREVWRYSKRLNELRMMKNKRIDTCSECALLDNCKFKCMGLFHLSTGRYEVPSPLHCEITASWMGLDKK